MEDLFLSKIKILESRNIKNLEISLSKSERKHLIITGKNGSGKTSLLFDINNQISLLLNGGLKDFDNNLTTLNRLEEQYLAVTNPNSGVHYRDEQRISIKRDLDNYRNWFLKYSKLDLSFTNRDKLLDLFNEGRFIYAFFDAKRLSNLKVPTGINKIDLKKKYSADEKANQSFMQYIVNLKAERSFARDDNDFKTVEIIDNWFANFENRLKDIFDAPDLRLIFDRKNYNFLIEEGNKTPYTLNTLSDGYSAIISIITEFILRMESHVSNVYNIEGIVLIDEIETHLHVELQKKILPFLTDFFPKIQFIVTTHSPFILSSISNAVICDLESTFVTNDLSGYSYDALIESYFYSDKYSEEIKQKVINYELLSSLEHLSNEQKDNLRQLRNYFAHVPKYLSKELMVKLQQIELKNLPKRDKK